jgi:pentatricopeptide repeat protein
MAIRTPTLAEIYARQGHLDEAIAIYEHLVAEGHDHIERLETLKGRADDARQAAQSEARIERLRVLLRRVHSRARTL